MALMDIFEIGDVFLSWRFYVGTAATAAVCWIVFTCIPNETAARVIAAPLGIAGLGLSFWWQVRGGLR
ncbi:hypothetical protein [Lysobacter capsici]|jgi:hypothetical protein|uniref:hypothetical protein n=1 Tax=Lysobacter capsici TaxID=435897 RepID=UPI000BBB533F|nr:hypothetical protein [Lysobacter capsici]ATE74119.1 hypothetical protein CNO08_23830 [Lysobacter capsici]